MDTDIVQDAVMRYGDFRAIQNNYLLGEDHYFFCHLQESDPHSNLYKYSPLLECELTLKLTPEQHRNLNAKIKTAPELLDALQDPNTLGKQEFQPCHFHALSSFFEGALMHSWNGNMQLFAGKDFRVRTATSAWFQRASLINSKWRGQRFWCSVMSQAAALEYVLAMPVAGLAGMMPCFCMILQQLTMDWAGVPATTLVLSDDMHCHNLAALVFEQVSHHLRNFLRAATQAQSIGGSGTASKGVFEGQIAQGGVQQSL
jgi:hypothetical protein